VLPIVSVRLVVPPPTVNVATSESGAVVMMGNVATEIVNGPSLMSLTVSLTVQVTRTRPCVVGVVGTVHAYVEGTPGTLAMMVLHAVPLFVLYSSFTELTAPVRAQVMFRTPPVGQSSPPFGAVTLTVPIEIVNGLLLMSFTFALSVQLTRTRPCVVGVVGTVQAYVEGTPGTLATMVLHAVPLFVLYSSFTLFTTPVRTHVMFCTLPVIQVSPPFGAVTVTVFALVFASTVMVRRCTGVPFGPLPVIVTVYIPAMTLFVLIFNVTESGYAVSESRPPMKLKVNGAAGDTVAENFATPV